MEVIPLPSSEAQLNYNLVGQQREIPKRPSVSQSVWCELCRIECTSVQDYEKHLSGTKHTKVLLNLNARALKAAAEKTAGSGGGGEIVYSAYVAGKQHIAQASVSMANPNPISVDTKEITEQSYQAQKRKFGESSQAWCDVCKISCTSNGDLQKHLLGKKHHKNLMNLQNTETTSSSAGLSGTTVAPNPPKPPEVMMIGQTDEVHRKKQKILQSGTAASALRTCTACNVVCNSDIAFKAHLAGQKHAAMVKQAGGPKGGLQIVYPAM